jgi:hypothetical protein
MRRTLNQILGSNPFEVTPYPYRKPLLAKKHMSALSILAKNTSIKTVDNRPKRWSLVQMTM